MKVINIHKRIIDRPVTEVSKLMYSLATKEDQIWPNEKWPAMRFKYGLVVESEGGHGMIRYKIESYQPRERIKFRFLKPRGFIGFHQLEFKAVNAKQTKVMHSINMRTTGIATLKWIVVIRSLHNALIEDAFDKIENLYLIQNKQSTWSVWVKLWRFLLK
ncbi:hypothetical protein A9Q87_11435 [Flavobacteriales bacterium 34_180_T64]|nr:hypothetical protein A9Q87_11435 [Flavobacteriales bacterium 34_180_T64]